MHHHRQIIFKFHRLVFLMNKISDKLLQQKANLTYSQFLILMATNRHPEVSQRSIAEFLEVTEAAVSRQIELLITKKLLIATENQVNRREHRLGLTREGIKQLNQATIILDQAYQEFLAPLDQSDQKRFTDYLDCIFGIVCTKGKQMCRWC